MRHIQLLLFFSLCLIARADCLDAFRANRGLSPESSSVMVIDLATGEELASHNSAKPLIPASIMKCVTVATLLDKMDIEETYRTRVYVSGGIKDGVLDGNLVTEGAGDPSLNSRYVEGSTNICREVADALVAEGVTVIKGRILADETIWEGPAVPPSWMSGDLPHSYGTGSHGLNFEDNASGSRSVSNPAAVYESRLRSELLQKGIAVEGEDIIDGELRLLIEHESLPLDEIMRSCMMRSDNQYAEALLRTYGARTYGKGGTVRSAENVMSFWKELKSPMSGVNIVDGSGLSRANRVTAQFMASVLKERASNPYYASFFPLAGMEGTLKNFLRDTPLEGYVAMKTGSMKGIQCYAGYKLDEDYVPTHIIVFILNEMKSRDLAREAVAEVLLSLFSPGHGEILEETAE